METVKKDIFINGRSKAFEIIQMLNETERSGILNKIKLKNPKLAEELMQNSYSFKDIAKLNDLEIESIFPEIPPQVFGVALRNLNADFQRRVLTLAPRKYAESAFETLTGNLGDEATHIKRARNRVSEIVIEIIKSNSKR
jgi:flagellar motor switch protein FliG